VFDLAVPRGRATGVGQMPGEPGRAVDVDEDLGQRDGGQPRVDAFGLGHDGRVDGLRDQWREVQLAVLIETDGPVPGPQHRLEQVQVAVEFGVHGGEAFGEAGRDPGTGHHFVAAGRASRRAG